MAYEPPKPIKLSKAEQKLHDGISFNPSPNSGPAVLLANGKSVAALFRKLFKRNAIPQERLDYFFEPEMNVTHSQKSRAELFLSQCGDEEAMFQHPNFAKYLDYFLEGPSLEPETIEQFCKVLIDDMGTSGMLLDQICAFVRKAVRQSGLTKKAIYAEEFFKLAHELGLDQHQSKSIRNAALAVRG